jgi:hypothetical protein
MKQSQFYIVVALIFATIGISACTSFVPLYGHINAATYQPHPEGSTFFIVLNDNFTLTDQNMKALIAKEMEKLGFKQVFDLSTTDLAVVYSYSIGAGTTSVSSSPDFVWGGQEVTSETEYPRYFQVAIIDHKKTLDPKKPIFLWQAELYSTGSSSNISLLAESFIPELFKWYGKNTTNKIFITH